MPCLRIFFGIISLVGLVLVSLFPAKVGAQTGICNSDTVTLERVSLRDLNIDVKLESSLSRSSGLNPTLSFITPETNHLVQHVHYNLVLRDQSGKEAYNALKIAGKLPVSVDGHVRFNETSLQPGLYTLIVTVYGIRSPAVPVTPQTASFPCVPIFRVWYLGEGVIEGMKVSYIIERNENGQVRRYNLTVGFNGENQDGNWLSDFNINENGTRVESEIGLRQSELHPVYIANESDSMNSYVNDYIQSIKYLGSWAAKSDPRSLQVSSWGSLACEGCPRPELLGLETITVLAGTFNATLVSYPGSFKVWILDEFPYPIKGIIDSTESPDNVAYSFELVEASVNGVSIPEFGQAYPPAIFAISIGLIITLYFRASKTKLRHSMF